MSSVERNVYVDEFFDSYCCADVLPFYGNYMAARERNKEITESMSCLHGALDYLLIDRKDQNVVVLVIGDGKYSRTGSLFAFFTSWTVLSIDPMLDLIFHDAYTKFKETLGRPIQRLHIRPMIFEDMSMTQIPLRQSLAETKMVVVLPHSHVHFESVVDKIASQGNEEYEYSVVSLPCCVPLPPQLVSKRAVDVTNFLSYTDLNVRSDKKTMVIHRKMSQKIYNTLVRERKKRKGV